MGCASSKILTKSSSFRGELGHSFRRQAKSLEELLASNSSGNQFLALLCSANTVARKLKPDSSAADANHSSNTLCIKASESEDEPNRSKDAASIETINSWELLEGLDDDKEEEEEKEKKEGDRVCQYQQTLNKGESCSKRFRTVEEFDEMVAKIRSNESGKEVSENNVDGSVHAADSETGSVSKEATTSREKGWRRKEMAKELGQLRVRTFEFSRDCSLRDWLLKGGQVFSPGSYVTPKFGNFTVAPWPENSSLENKEVVFDPELVLQLEEAMEQLSLEEENIIKHIVEASDREMKDVRML